MEGDKTEMGMLGSPVEHITVTITTTIAYKPKPTPTLAPGDSIYSLLGCYGRGAGDSKGGHPFGNGEGYASPIIPPDKMTIDACLKRCAAMKPRKSSGCYEYAGLMNGGEYFCGSKLDSAAYKLSPEECQTPCSGDNGLPCGGSDTIAVYSRIAANDNKNNVGSSKDASQSTHAKPRPSSTSEGVVFRSGGRAGTNTETNTWSSTSTTPTLTPGESKTASATNTIAAVTGSLSGAIILAAFSFICFRSYKRKKLRLQHDGHTEQKDGKETKRNSRRRPIPSAIDTKPGHARGKSKDDDSLGATTDFRDMMPTTPALESGGRMQHSGLHVRLRSPRSPKSSSDRDSLYDTLMGEVKAGPAPPKPPQPPVDDPSSSSSAASSAVQWRDAPPQTPSTASTALFNFGFDGATNFDPGSGSGSGAGAGSKVTSPAAAARSEASLGARAWHRRKLSTPFQPPASGPPSVPLPPTPPHSKFYGVGRGANLSSRSLGAESVPPTPPLKDSPTLPRKTQPGSQGSEGEAGKDRVGEGTLEKEGEDMEPTIPVLTPGEEFVAKPRRGTMYAGPRDESDDEDDEKKSEASTSLSATTMATSILFTAPLDNDDDDRMWSGA